MLKRKDIEKMSYEDRQLVILEALLRRISLVNMPFVLKGSLLTRQYLENPDIRYVNDIDFLYLGKINDAQEANEIFTNWMIQVTEMDLNDGIQFRSFREINFWGYIDYAMTDDFPTVYTDLEYWFVDDPENVRWLELDVSFNLELEMEPVPLEYRPVFGERFVVPYSVPLPIQVAWKLHQTIVRPRFKDLYDLKYLLSHPSYDEQALQVTLQTLVNECSLEPEITKEQIKKVLVDDLTDLYPALSNDYLLKKYADQENLETYYMAFVKNLRQIMNERGINQQAFENLPSPTIKN